MFARLIYNICRNKKLISKDAKEELQIEFQGDVKKKMEYFGKNKDIFEVGGKPPGERSDENAVASEHDLLSGLNKSGDLAQAPVMEYHVNIKTQEAEAYEDPVNIKTGPPSTRSSSAYSSGAKSIASRVQSAKIQE